MNIDEEVKGLMIALNEKDEFVDINSLFLDLAERPDFRKLGRLKNNKLLTDTLTAVARRIIDSAPITEFMAVCVDKYRLWHGVFFTKGQLTTFFYFEAVNTGLLAIARGQGHIDFARFTLIKDKFYSKNHPQYTN
ncbi:MAG: hypothetical protein L3V56_06630 [Candidatus Magnetoovum sp. WYHC-5]|nr:hypothetical protein [Candidatus Magnetoovum sp. WYHC-5]